VNDYKSVEEIDARLEQIEADQKEIYAEWGVRSFDVETQARWDDMKVEKDEQDIDMIRRRAALFGRENNSIYLADHQFILHKDHYLKHFGANSKPLTQPA